MTPEDAIRFLDHQAAQCRGRDASEALCLLLPAMLRILGLDRMEDIEALAFRQGFKRDLAALPDRFGGAEIKGGKPVNGHTHNKIRSPNVGTVYADSRP